MLALATNDDLLLGDTPSTRGLANQVRTWYTSWSARFWKWFVFCRRRTGISPQTLLKRVPVGNTTPFLSGGHLPLMKNKVAWYPQEFLDMFSQKEKLLRRTLPPQPWDETHRPQNKSKQKGNKKIRKPRPCFQHNSFCAEGNCIGPFGLHFLFKGTLHCKLAGPPMLC